MAGAIGRDIYAFQVHEALSFRYILYALRHTIDMVVANAKGDIPGLSKSHILDHSIVLPSVNQQHRIVAKIEELFSEIDKGVESLTTAREQLKVYRQAVLKHAFEGKLTADWRVQAGVDSIQGKHLETQVQDERAATHDEAVKQWQASLELWRNRGELGERPAKPRPMNNEAPANLSATHKPEVPECWTAMPLGMLNVEIFDGPFGSNLKTSDYVEKGVRVVRLENIGRGTFIDEKRTFVSQEKFELLTNHTVSAGDIVFSSFVLDAIRSAVVPPSISIAVNKADCFAIKLLGTTVSAEFVARFMQSRNAFKQVEGTIHGVGRPRINTSQLKQLQIPICSQLEQEVITGFLEAIWSGIESLEGEIEAQLQRVSTLRQSILRNAFSGQLVPQDPNDEPASVLLERIKAEKERSADNKQKPQKLKAQGAAV